MENLERSKQADEGANSKTTQGQQYKLEKERIKYEIGDLEQIRLSLGYSQRRMCQLLLVDPSAWTRWTKSLSGAPPHIYQALKWLVELKKVNPEAAVPTNLAKRLDFVQASTESRFKSLDYDFEAALKLQENRLALAIAMLEAKLQAALTSSNAKVKSRTKKKLKNKKPTKKRLKKLAQKNKIKPKKVVKKRTKKTKKSKRKKKRKM